MLNRGLELIAEFLQFLAVYVADRPEAEVRPGPAPNRETLQFFHRRSDPGTRSLRNEQIDDMGASLIDDRRDRPAIDVVETAADERKTLWRQVDDRGCYAETAV